MVKFPSSLVSSWLGRTATDDLLKDPPTGSPLSMNSIATSTSQQTEMQKTICAKVRKPVGHSSISNDVSSNRVCCDVLYSLGLLGRVQWMLGSRAHQGWAELGVSYPDGKSPPCCVRHVHCFQALRIVIC